MWLIKVIGEVMSQRQLVVNRFPTRKALIFFLSAFLVAQCFAQQPSDVKPIAPQKYQALLGKGLDVDWSKTGQGKENYNEQTVKDFKAIGLSHVRIRVTEDTKTDDLGLLERQVNDCLKHGLIPVVAFQANFFKENPSNANLQKAVAWWQAVAERFRNTSHLLSFDLIIEVTDALNKNQAQLDKYFEQTVTEIRRTNPTRILFISPRLRSEPGYLADLKIPSKANGYLMAEWHFYASGPSRNNPNKQWTTGTAAEKQLILDKIKTALDWSKKNSIPTWVGAWMPSDFDEGNNYTIEEQVAFSRFVTCELDRVGIPFSVNSDTKFYNRASNTWIPEMLPVLKEILTKRCG